MRVSILILILLLFVGSYEVFAKDAEKEKDI